MKLSLPTAFVDAWTAWRRDSAVLLPLAGLTMFLPQYAVLLLVPPMPPAVVAGGGAVTEAAAMAWADAFSAWVARYGGWYALAALIGLYGGLAVMAFLLDGKRPSLGGALGRALTLLFRYLLASILVAVPAISILMPGTAHRLLLAALIPVAFYILGRTMLAGPVVVAQAPVGAIAAIQRSWRMTKGNGGVLAASYAIILFAAQLLGGMFLSLAALGVGRDGANPVVAAAFDGAASLVTAIAALALALVQVALYRRLSNSGT